jgi:hypothetical protein
VKKTETVKHVYGIDRAIKTGLLNVEDCQYLKDEFWIYIDAVYPKHDSPTYVMWYLSPWLPLVSIPMPSLYTVTGIGDALFNAFKPHFQLRIRPIRYSISLDTPDSKKVRTIQTTIHTALREEQITRDVLIDIAKTFGFLNFKNKHVFGQESDFELSTIIAYYLGPGYGGTLITPFSLVNEFSKRFPKKWRKNDPHP